MNTREDFEKYLKSRGIEYNEDTTDEEIKDIVMERMEKEAQTS